MKGKTRIYLAKSLSLFLAGCISLSPTGLIFAEETLSNEITIPTESQNPQAENIPSEISEDPVIDTPAVPTPEETEELPVPEIEEDPLPAEESELSPEVTFDEPLAEEEESPDEPTSSSLLEEEEIVNSSEARKTAQAHIFPKADNTSGSFIYEVPIEVPPGRNGLEPDLTLRYNSQDKDEHTLLGYGWKLSIPVIKRLNKKGSQNLYSTSTFFTSSISGELVPDASISNLYWAKDDTANYLRYEFNASTTSWTLTDKNGTVFSFGTDTSAITASTSPGNTLSVSEWYLRSQGDTNGNTITYFYDNYNFTSVPHIQKITYGNVASSTDVFEVSFSWETRPDEIGSYMTAAAPIIITKRIKEITTKANNVWLRKYVLNYSSASNEVRHLLASITESVRSEAGVEKTLSPITFTYSTAVPTWNLATSGWELPVLFTNNGSDVGVRLADVNSDGLTDIVQAKEAIGFPTGTVTETYINNGNGWTASSTWRVPFSFFQAFNLGFSHTQGTRLADVNGDGRIDFLLSTQERETYDTRDDIVDVKEVFLNTGNGWTASSTFVIPELFVRFRDGTVQNAYANPRKLFDNGVRLYDVNGDGLPDIVRADGHGNTVYLNTGYGWTHDPSWDVFFNFSEDFTSNNSLFIKDNGVHLEDVNADGFSDLLLSEAIYYIDQDRQIFLNYGKGWESNPLAIDPQLPVDGLIGPGGSDAGVRFADRNADNVIDLLQYGPGSWEGGSGSVVPNVYRGELEGFNVSSLSLPQDTHFSAGNSAGNVIDAGIRMADINGDGIYDILRGTTIKLPGPCCSYGDKKEVYLSTYKKPDLLTGITLPTGGSFRVTYKPTGQEEKSPGVRAHGALPMVIDVVASIASNDGLGNYGTTTYNYKDGFYSFQDSHNRRFGGFSEVTETDPLGNTHTTFYHQGNSTNSAKGEYDDHVSKIGRPYRLEVRDSASNLLERITQKWDKVDKGNGRNQVLLKEKTHTLFGGGNTHAKATAYTYDTVGNITQKVLYGEVSASDDGTFSDIGTDKITTGYGYAYDTNQKVLGSPVIINTTNQSSVKESETIYVYDNLSFGLVSKGNPTQISRWRSGSTYANENITYNSYGQRATTTNPRNYSTGIVYDDYSLYPKSTTNAKGQITQYLYNIGVGKVKRHTDPNGKVVENDYDGFGRITAFRGPDPETGTLTTLASYTYTDTPLSGAENKTRFLGGGLSQEFILYKDGFGREIQSRESAENSPYFIVRDRTYNTRGELASASLPYPGLYQAKSSPLPLSNIQSFYTYDALGRPVSISTSQGTTTHAYNGQHVTVTDTNNKQKVNEYDAYGRLKAVVEITGAGNYRTEYTYNSNNNLISLTDALGNTRAFTYDGLGNRLTAQDLHASGDGTFGSWTFLYDLNNNLATSTNPKNQTVLYAYDELDRPLSENFTGQAGTEAVYVYDSCTKGIGRLCQATRSSSATTTFTYDFSGNIKSEIKTIDGIGFITFWNRNLAGMTTSIIYPDFSKVTYTYNQASLPEALSFQESVVSPTVSIITNINYDSSKKPTLEQFGNGLEHAYTNDINNLYRTTRRIITIPPMATSGPRRTISDQTFTYDSVGNITKINDSSGNTLAKEIVFTYDDLHRLTLASSTDRQTATSTQNTFQESYSYNAIGNLLTKNSITYQYVATGTNIYANPHAATQIASTTYVYDQNGHLVQRGSDVYNWTYDSKLSSLTMGSSTQNYLYDHGGSRVKVSGIGDTMYYPNNLFSATATTSTKHLLVDDRPVVVIEKTGATSTYRFISGDHLLSTNFVTDGTGNVVQTLDYYPYGGERIDNGTDVSQRQYIGEYYDEGTGLNYLNARYYEGSRGQFLSQDPTHLAIGDSSRVQSVTGKDQLYFLVDPQLLNSYAYGRGNPIKYSDPQGTYIESGFDVAMFALSVQQFYQDPSWTNAGAVVLDAGSIALPGVPAVGGIALRSGRVAGDAASLIAKNRAAGALGEQAAGIVKNTEKISSVTKPGTSRIPDVLDHGSKVIGDVKNVNYQSFTSQLRDFANYAQQNSYRFILTVDQRTQLSQTLQQISQKIEIIRKDLNNLTKGKQ